MNESILDEAKRLLDGITEGDWEWGEDVESPDWTRLVYREKDGAVIVADAEYLSQEDAEFIAASPRLVRELVSEVDELNRNYEKLKIACLLEADKWLAEIATLQEEINRLRRRFMTGE